MPRNLPPLNALRAFEAAGRHGSFTGAAEELNVSHSAISRHVRGLEARLGAQLFTPQARGVALTQQGERYLAALTPALDDIADATEVFAREAEGKVLINSDPLYAERWLIPRLGDFQALHPKVQIDLVASIKLADLARHEADLALRFILRDAPEGETTLLTNTRIYPFATKSLAARINKPKDLTQEKLLMERKGEPWENWFKHAGVATADIPEVTRTWEAPLAVAAAVSGQGVILTNPEIIEQEVADGRLVRVFDIGLRLGSYHLVFSEGARRRRAVRLVADWMLEQGAKWRDAQTA